jgi:hypothetical protein
MRKFLFIAIALTILASTPPASALTMKKKAVPNGGIFGIEVSGTDLSFYGRADRVISISFQEYTTGTFIVSEVVIDMSNSNQQLRIYNTRTPGSGDVADRANRASTANSENRGLNPADASKLPIPSQLSALESKVTNLATGSTAGLVVKTYPSTTHAKTVEMAVSSKAELKSFYAAFKNLLCGTAVPASSGTTTETTDATGAATINQIGGTIFIIQ